MEDKSRLMEEYRKAIQDGRMPAAYRTVMSFLSELKSSIEAMHPGLVVGALYHGYMDMSFFAVAPPSMKAKKLKVAVVFVHEGCRFEAWLAAANRKLMSEWSGRLSGMCIGGYTLVGQGPGVDAIILGVLDERPDFSDVERLKKQLIEKLDIFIADMQDLITS